MRGVDAVADILNRIARPDRVRAVAITVIALAAVLLLILFATAEDRETLFGPQLGADYASFYIAGTILNSAHPERLYDLQLQTRLYHEFLPQAPRDSILPYPYAPFFALFVRPLALLPYEWSYGAWLMIGLAAYMVGFLLLWKANPTLNGETFPVALLAALSFVPFMLEGWIGGQSVGIIMLVIGIAVFCVSRGHDALGGFALAVCLFKPTLLVLILPMLLFRRCFRALAGFGCGAAVVSGLSWLAVGGDGLADYARLLHRYARVKSMAPEAFRTFKYVDLTSFTRLLTPGQTAFATFMAIAVSLGISLVLVYFWWSGHRAWSPMGQLSWATALVWTPVLAPQCAIYDVTLVVPGMLLMAGALGSCKPMDAGRSKEHLRAMAVVLYVSAWVTQPLAVASGVQVITLVVLVIGVYALWITHRMERCQSAS